MSIYAKCPNHADIRFYGRHWIDANRYAEEWYLDQLHASQSRERARVRWRWLLVLLGCE